MSRRFLLIPLAFVSWGLIVGFMSIVPTFTVDTFLLLATVASIVTLSRPSPAGVRSFWERITARTDLPVPRTP